jgi:hypothetical protein
MAEARRHAAGRSVYEVHEILGVDPGLDLGSRFECADYLEAFDFALDFLQEHDPEREGKVSGLDIKQVEGTEKATVWAYRHRPPEQAPNDPPEQVPNDLVARWGFDPRSWQGPSALTA